MIEIVIKASFQVKIHRYHGPVGSFFQDFLFDHKQRVVADGVTNELFTILSSEAHSSVLRVHLSTTNIYIYIYIYIYTPTQTHSSTLYTYIQDINHCGSALEYFR